MRFIEKGKFKSIFFLLIVATLLTIVAVLMARSNSNYGDKLTFILEGCQNNNGSLSYNCFRNKLTPLVKKDHLREIAFALDSLFTQADPYKYGVVSCHGPGHVLGEIAVGENIEWEQIAESCGRSCDYGCQHGAFGQLLQGDQNFASNLKDICMRFSDNDISQYNYENESCYHVVGHALGGFYPGVTIALNACGEFMEEWQRSNCAEGTLMDYFFGSTRLPGTFKGGEEEIIAFCNALRPEYAQVCLENLGFYVYSIVPDKGKAAKTCLKVREDLQESCFYSLGNRVFLSFTKSPEEIVRYCSQTGTFMNACIRGAIEGDVRDIITASKETEFSLALCQSLGKEGQEECLRFLSNMVNYIWGE